MERINFGVIGSGLWGESHAQIFSTHPWANLSAVCDLNKERAAEIAVRYGAEKHYDKFEKILEDPDIQAVGIATPDFAHREPFIAACQAGKDILIEKPLATKLEDLKAMREAFLNSKSRVMVDFHSRWNPPFVNVR